VAVDNAGNVYVADTYNNTIRKLTGAGTASTLAGSPGQFGSADGTNGAARFSYPSGLAVDNLGNVYVADEGNSTIRKVTGSGVVTTLAGLAGQSGTADGTNGAARFFSPEGIAVDSQGNLFVADAGNSTIRKITRDGMVTTLAGLAGVSGSADGTNSTARFFYPSGLAVDGGGNVYVADLDNHTIRRISASGEVTTLAGTAGEFGSADGTNGAAQFFYPSGVAVDGAGNVYVADSYNSTLRKITSGGVVTTLAGSPGATGSTDGLGAEVQFYYPSGLALDSAGNIYVADTFNSAIRKVTGGGMVTTLAGQAGQAGSADANGSGARFRSPFAITVDGNGNLYVADTLNNTIRKVTTGGGLVATLAGSVGQSGSANGTNTGARFNAPYGLAAGPSGTLYVADTYNNTIRKVSSGGVVTTLAGFPGQAGSTDGTNSAARFSYPVGMALDSAGNLYVADFYSNIIRKVTSAGVVSTLAGSAGHSGSADGGATGRFNGPYGVAVDSEGTVYVTDSGNQTIRRVGSDGVVSTLAGSSGQIGSTDGTNSAARFFYPAGLALDGTGNLYVADLANSTIRKVTTNGVVTTLAGSATQTGSADGIGSSARFFNPGGLAADSAGDLYVVDGGNNTIRKVTSAGVVTTLAGSPGIAGSDDVTGEIARFYGPSAVTVDNAGNLYVADTYNNTIRKRTTDGAVTTLAGTAGNVGSGDGPGSWALFSHPSGVAADSAGNVFVADSNNSTIRKVTKGGDVSTLAGTAGQPGSADGSGSSARFSYPSGLAVDKAGNIYVTDFDSSTIRKVTGDGVVTTLAGSPGQLGIEDGTGAAARFGNPNGVTVDSAGNLYVADSGNSTIRKITGAGVVTTLAGSPGQSGSLDGTGSGARFAYPVGIAVDSWGNIYVADSGSSTLRKVTSGGVVTTIGGLPGVRGGTDGIGSAATFAGPTGLTVDTSGRLYVADPGNNRISKGVLLAELSITRAGGNVILWWPSAAAGLTLEQSSDVTPNSWSVSGYPIQDDGTNRTVTLGPPAGNQFFRLNAN
jgi:sugar lactone lactonase YvrE